MIAEDEKPARDARKGKVGKIIDRKKHEPIGTEEAEQKVADDLHQAAEHDIKIHKK